MITYKLSVGKGPTSVMDPEKFTIGNFRFR